jgi:hypothetical protein
VISPEAIAGYLAQSKLILNVAQLGSIVSNNAGAAMYHSMQFPVEIEFLRLAGLASEDTIRATASHRIRQIDALVRNEDPDMANKLIGAVEKSLRFYLTGDSTELEAEISAMERKIEEDLSDLERSVGLGAEEDEDAPEGDDDYWSNLLGR